VSHLVAFGVSLLTGTLLVLAGPTTGARLLLGVYGLSLSGLFGVSALYHRPNWSPRVRHRLRRLDHATIFVAIAGTYTAIAGLTLPTSTAWLVLTVVWVCALVGAALQLFRGFAAPWLSAGLYLALGWAALAVTPQLAETLGRGGFALLVSGAALYSVGALVYARKRPDPSPLSFGYHEVFHLLVIAAAAAHYATVAGYVLPRL
jgi:hemolysin III